MPELENVKIHEPLLYSRILWGVIQDGGGVVWIPGRGPVPVGPWGPLSHVSQDLLSGFTAHALAGEMNDHGLRRELQAVSIRAMQTSLNKLEESSRQTEEA